MIAREVIVFLDKINEQLQLEYTHTHTHSYHIPRVATPRGTSKMTIIIISCSVVHIPSEPYNGEI